MHVDAPAVAEASLELVVIRCGCGDPDSHNGRRPGRFARVILGRKAGPAGPCPQPRAVEDLGVVDSYRRE